MLMGRALILPSPIAVFLALIRIGAHGIFWRAALLSLIRIICGFAAGVILGTILAVLTRASKIADTLLSPAVRVVRATPVASFIILVLLWTTRALVPGVISALMVIPVMWAQVSAGVSSADPLLLEMARAYKFGLFRTIRLVYIPSITPHFLSACLTAQGLAWKSGIAAEVLCLPRDSIGTRLYYSKLYINTDELFAWTVTVIILSFILEGLFRRFFSRLGKAGADA
jgi:NitT/TauT family transport system permease protein